VLPVLAFAQQPSTPAPPGQDLIARGRILHGTDWIPLDQLPYDLCMAVVTAAMENEASAVAKRLIKHLFQWLCTFKREQFPVVTASRDPRLRQRVSVVRYISTLAAQVVVNVQWSIRMPCGSSTVEWLPCLPHNHRPVCPPTATFRSISVGKLVVQPRRTAAFGQPYKYSGKTTKLEEKTPSDVEALYNETNAIFDYTADKMNMVLVNRYENGYQNIGEHSDNENAFGSQQDVCCWVVGDEDTYSIGDEARVLVFRVKKIGSGGTRRVEPSLHSLCSDPDHPLVSRHVLSLKIPSGVYAMHDPLGVGGPLFQQKYSHEMPKRHPALMERIRTGLMRDRLKWPDFPRKVPLTTEGASQTALVQYAWIQANPGPIIRALSHGDFHPKNRSKSCRTGRKDLDAFADWLIPRTSFTLRSFTPSVIIPPTTSRKRQRT
jgi:hypothetical protein